VPVPLPLAAGRASRINGTGWHHGALICQPTTSWTMMVM
jgi:hypothetical protein